MRSPRPEGPARVEACAPEGLAEPRHLGKGAGGQGGAGRFAEAAAIGDAAGNRHDILEGAADLDAPEVVEA